jgi:hypothetical protein
VFVQDEEDVPTAEHIEFASRFSEDGDEEEEEEEEEEEKEGKG